LSNDCLARSSSRLAGRDIASGESYEICLTNQLRPAMDISPLTSYQGLRELNPAPYSVYLQLGRYPRGLLVAGAILAHPPGRQRRFAAHSRAPTGAALPSRTTRNCERRWLQARSRAENLVIVDVADLGRVYRFGSVHVPHMMQVETYPTVHQLVSTIRGRLNPDTSALQGIRAAFQVP
jgi:para-aminobenzoate synthetase